MDTNNNNQLYIYNMGDRVSPTAIALNTGVYDDTAAAVEVALGTYCW